MSEPRRAPAPLILAGGAALLVAVATDALAVVGRHAGFPLLGSIEIVQAAVLVASAVAILVATIEVRHAAVHLLVDRMNAGAKDLLTRFSRAVAALLFVALIAGSLWIASDLWGGHEESELLRIPYSALRVIEIVALIATLLVLIAQTVRRRQP
jgi:TRAP-type C4-dicarboxylate transport system permease small subunit